MKKLFKWPGGKSRELKLIKELMPKEVSLLVEPFCGSAALSFDLEIKSVLNDLDKHIINFYKVVRDKEKFSKLKAMIDSSKSLTWHDKKDPNRKTAISLENEYYRQRTIFNSKSGTDIEQAYAFFILRQLSFSGMIRYNPTTGYFNAAYGWYKKFTDNLTNDASLFLQGCSITNKDYEKTLIENDNKGTFFFIDPPYRNRSGYPAEDWDDDNFHINLSNAVKSLKNAKWMIVHCDDDLYKNLYSDVRIETANLNYAIAFKDRSTKNRKVKHLYIMNY